MGLKTRTIFINTINNKIEFVAQEFKCKAQFINEIKRRVVFPYDENYNFSYVIEEGGFYMLQENGDKIILQ